MIVDGRHVSCNISKPKDHGSFSHTAVSLKCPCAQTVDIKVLAYSK